MPNLNADFELANDCPLAVKPFDRTQARSADADVELVNAFVAQEEQRRATKDESSADGHIHIHAGAADDDGHIGL